MSMTVDITGTQETVPVAQSTRRERRAHRRRWLVTTREARLARLARLDYKVSGETGAMRVPTKARTWYQGNRKNAHRPPPGRGWSRSGPTYVVPANQQERVAKQTIQHQRRRQQAEQPATSPTE